MIGIKYRKKNLICALAAAIYIAVASPCVYAANDVSVMQAYASEETITLYVDGATAEQGASAQIGTEPIDDHNLYPP